MGRLLPQRRALAARSRAIEIWFGVAGALALFAAAPLEAGQPHLLQDSNVHIVTGLVTEDPTGVPISAARVSAISSGGLAAVETDAQGRFTLDNLPAGRHVLRIEAAGYQPAIFDLPAGSAMPIRIALAPAIVRHEEVLHVTASREARHGSDLPYSTSVVDAAELARRFPRSAPEALMDAPGVLLQKTNHGSGSPYVRGLLGNQVLVLIDGIRLNNSTFRYGPNQYLATIDPGQIERIEVVRGAGAVLYGSDAIGGVINIITKRPALGARKGLTAAAAGRLVSSGMEQSGRVEIESSGTRMAVRGGASLRSFGDVRAGGSLGTQVPSGYAEASGDVAAAIGVAGRSQLELTYQHLHQDDVPRFDQVTLRGFSRYSFAPQSRQLAAAAFSHVPAAGLIRRFESTVSFHRSFERRELRRADAAALTIEQDSVRTLGASLQASLLPWRGLTLQTGLDVYRDWIGSSRRDEIVGTGASTSRRGLYPDGASAASVAAFVYGTRSWQRMTVDGGVRYSRFDISASDATFGSIDVVAGAWTGQAGAAYQATASVQIVGSISQAFRAPNVDDVSSLGLFDSGIEAPSPDLVPERAWSVDGGVRLRAGGAAVSIVAFRTNLRDLIDRVPSTFEGSAVYEGQPVFRKANVQRAYVYGAELEGQWLTGPALLVFGHASYTFGHQPLVDQPMRRIPPLHGLAGARWTQPAGGLWIEGRVRAAGAQTRLSSGDRSDHRIDPNGTPGWVVVSFGAGCPIGSRLEVVGSVENVFNEAYRVHGSGIDSAGRHVWIGLRLTAGGK